MDKPSWKLINLKITNQPQPHTQKNIYRRDATPSTALKMQQSLTNCYLIHENVFYVMRLFAPTEDYPADNPFNRLRTNLHPATGSGKNINDEIVK